MIRNSLLLLLLLISSASAFALGLGGIKVESALNEPLDAKVRLISVEQMAIDDIRVKLAGPEGFRRAGIERPFLLSKLRFRAVFPENGDPYIQVSTREAIREPFLDFLLEVSWPQGNLVREFTILLDPPTYQPPRSEAVALSSERNSAAPASSSSAASTYGPVQRTETLWVIAGKVQPDADVSRNRTMVALLKSNPDAFHRGNINLLKKGALLTIPTPGEIAAITETEARATVKQQMDEWRKGRRVSTAPPPTDNVVEPRPAVDQQSTVPDTPVVESTGRQADGERAQEPIASVAPGEELTAEERQRLRVVEPDRNWQLAEKSEADYPAQESDKLREAIKDSEQELVAVQEINRDIVELRAALESKVEALKKALEEKDAQLENLRQQIAQVGSKDAVPGQGVATDAATVMSSAPPPTGNVSVSAPVTDISPMEAVWKDEYWMILMGAVIVVLSTLLLLNMRGRRRETAFEAPALFEMSGETTAPDRNESVPPVEVVHEPADVPMTPVKAPRNQTHDEVSLLPEKSNDIASILMEADIYLAYRRYSQAESLVEEAMEQNPDSFELQAKLLEIYAFRRDKKAFASYLDQVYPALMNQSPELWEKVIDMGQHLVPEHPAWQRHESIDMILPAAPGKDTAGSAGQGAPTQQSPLDIDIDLDDLEISGEYSDAVTFGDLIQDSDESEDDDIPSIDMDFDFENPEDPQKDK